MNCLQYRITLPADYNMELIRERVMLNGYKTDKFDGLLYKFYLMAEKAEGGFQNEYAPLYIWATHHGINKFLFEGYFDSIPTSFGWQTIDNMVPYVIEGDLAKAKFVVQLNHKIKATDQMIKPAFTQSVDTAVAQMLVYNPATWVVSEYYFFDTKPSVKSNYAIYEVLHISEG